MMSPPFERKPGLPAMQATVNFATDPIRSTQNDLLRRSAGTEVPASPILYRLASQLHPRASRSHPILAGRVQLLAQGGYTR